MAADVGVEVTDMNWRAGSSRQINPGFPGCCARGTKRGAKSPSAFPLRCTVATASYVTLRKGTLLPLLVPVFPVQAMPGKGALVKSTLGSLAAVRVGPKEARKAHRPSHCGGERDRAARCEQGMAPAVAITAKDTALK
ncbi:hypothetical protein C8R47DRAFT_1085184 [Mycena vitilis]|nr:hypothetical protein C8R47DRAFT_1085184 [Mycena vitilis]